MLKTSLYSTHKALGARLTNFGEWMLPLYYSGVLEEHRHVRSNAGVFDVSHMGEIEVGGPCARAFLDSLCTNSVRDLPPGGGLYTPICNEAGGMLDDLLVYCLGEDRFFCCVNAARIEIDWEWFLSWSKKWEGVELHQSTKEWDLLAIQGPKSLEGLKGLGSLPEETVSKMPYMGILEFEWEKETVRLARSGYTGEKGYELYLPPSKTALAWERLLSPQNPAGVLPAGLGARDSLRLEAGYLLYGSDANETTSPLEAGIGWACKLTKEDFLGKKALVIQKEEGLSKKLVRLKMTEKSVPRQGMAVLYDGKVVGEITSGSILPTVGGFGAMAFVKVGLGPGTELSVDVRGKLKKATVIKGTFYSARTKDP